MPNDAQQLVCVPELEMAESPGSWLSKLALRQGIELRQLLRYLELPLSGDLDLSFVRSDLRRIAGICGMPYRHFDLIRKMYLGVSKLDRTGTKYLLSSKEVPRYRFCGPCLHAQRGKYFPLHWRFKAWRWCPEHMCMLDDACPHCSAPVVLPANMLKGGPSKEGIWTLGLCLACAGKLFAGHESAKGTLNFYLLTPWERVVLENGRALLAALYRQEVRIESSPHTFPLGAVRRLEKRGLLPHDHFKLTSLEVIRRHRAFQGAS